MTSGQESKFLGKRLNGDAYLSDGGLFYLNRVRMRPVTGQTAHCDGNSAYNQYQLLI